MKIVKFEPVTKKQMDMELGILAAYCIAIGICLKTGGVWHIYVFMLLALLWLRWEYICVIAEKGVKVKE